MKDFNVHHKSGMIIGNLQAETLVKAKNLAKKIYGPEVYVTPV